MINHIIPIEDQSPEALAAKEDYYGHKYIGTRVSAKLMPDWLLKEKIGAYEMELQFMAQDYNRLLAIALAFEHELKERQDETIS